MSVTRVVSPITSSWCSRRPGLGVCSPVIDLSPPPDRPDPSIYTQEWYLTRGFDGQWDNPDILLYAPPQFISGSWRIDPQWFLDNALVTVRNTSRTAAAINTVVAISYGPAGIGMPRIPLSTQLVSLAPGEARQLSIPLPASVLAQSVKALSFFVNLSHPYDSDVTNNDGASTIAVTMLSRGASGSIQIPIRNVTAAPITYRLIAGPNLVDVVLSAAQITVAPGSTDVVTAGYRTLQAPPGSTSFTVFALDEQDHVAGGFTSLLYFD